MLYYPPASIQASERVTVVYLEILGEMHKGDRVGSLNIVFPTLNRGILTYSI